MALKVLLLRKKLDEKRAELEMLRAAGTDFEKREAELEKDIEAAHTDEEKQAVEDAVNQLTSEQEQNKQAAQSLEGEIESIEKEIGEIERAQKPPAAPEKRGEDQHMETTAVTYSGTENRRAGKSRRFFDTLPMERRSAIVAREDVKAFLGDIRSIKNRRGVSNTELTIPIVMLDIVRENIQRYSKLLGVVRMRPVPGESRLNIAGTVPEAIWTEMCGHINELDMTFHQITLDGFKVAGYIPVCNSILEDSDLNLAAEVVEMLGQSIGLALDKAILYGKGAASKMPTGIVTRLAQTVKPSDYPAKAPEWKDLSAANIIKMADNLADKTFFAQFVLNAAKANTTYSRDGKFWAMNELTYATIISKALTFNAAGAIVAQVNGVMPVIGGNIVLLDFMKDGDVVGGYGDLYLLAQRAGIQIDQSEHVMFLQDNTVYRAKARYDGAPVIPEAFVAINISNKDVTTEMTFPPDTANTPETPAA